MGEHTETLRLFGRCVCASSINLPVSMVLRDLRVAVGRHEALQPLTDYRRPMVYRSKMPLNGFTAMTKSLPQLLPMTSPVLGSPYSLVAKLTEVGEALADV